jgi:sensor c-di-GMP phosphodiesterase-like protein
VVAEGVETFAQQEMLRHFGVDRAQGWLYGKALPAADIAPAPGAATAPPRIAPAAKLA